MFCVSEKRGEDASVDRPRLPGVCGFATFIASHSIRWWQVFKGESRALWPASRRQRRGRRAFSLRFLTVRLPVFECSPALLPLWHARTDGCQNQRVLLTHDVSTMTRFAYDRVREREPMPGVFEVSRKVSLAVAIDEILLLTECSDPGEWEGQVRYLPLL